MKKLLLLSSVLLIAICAVAYSYINTFNASGWASSNGLSSLSGTAYDLNLIAGGYSFRCSGAGTCYLINGGYLQIWDAEGSGYGPRIDIWGHP